MSEKLRPPSEVSAARLREIRTLEEAYSAVERLTRERDEATARVNQFQRADQISHERGDKAERELSEARLALILLEVDKAAAEKMAIETGRELAEARKVPEKAEGERAKMERACNEEGARSLSLALRAQAAESSLREHAEAIGVLRDAALAVTGPLDEPMESFASVEIEILRHALGQPIPALASRLLAEREAERAVVRAARRWVDSLQAAGKRYGVHYTGSPEYQYVADALAALPSSKGAIREAERLAYERARQIAQNVIDAGRRCGSETGSAELVRNEIIRALSQPETPATPSTDEEVRAWCERVYRETGVTPALRAAYEFYKANYRGEAPAEKTEGT
jgi:hypothetical protein